jgi:hypothetical protein
MPPLRTNPPPISTRTPIAQPGSSTTPATPTTPTGPTSPRSPQSQQRRPSVGTRPAGPSRLQQSMMSAEKQPVFVRNVGTMLRERGLTLYTANHVINEVLQQGESTPLPPGLDRATAGLRTDLDYELKSRKINNTEITLLFGKSHGKILEAAIPDAAVYAASPAAASPPSRPAQAAQQMPVAASSRLSATEALEARDDIAALPAQAPRAERTRTRPPRSRHAAPSASSNPAPLVLTSFTSFESLGVPSFPDEPEESEQAKTPSAGPATASSAGKGNASPQDGTASRDSEAGPAGSERSGTAPSSKALAKRLRGLLVPGARSASSADDAESGWSSSSRQSRVASRLASRAMSRQASRLSLRSAAESIMSIESIGEIIPDEDKAVYGEDFAKKFAKKFEKLLKNEYPWLTGAVKGENALPPRGNNESHEQWLNRMYIAPAEDRFMLAMLETVKERLDEMGIDPEGPIHQELAQRGIDIDKFLHRAAELAVTCCKSSEAFNHGPGRHYERIGKFAETHEIANHEPLDSLLENFAPQAKKALDEIWDMDKLPGFGKLSPANRTAYIVDKLKAKVMGAEHHPLLMLTCDYDRQYAYKKVLGIKAAMNPERKPGMAWLHDVHEAVAAGSTAFVSKSKHIDSGFTEGGPKFLMYEGLHYSEAGIKDLHAFKAHVDQLKSAYLMLHPDHEDKLKGKGIVIDEGPKGSRQMMFGRTDMPVEFLEFCAQHWFDEMDAVLDSDKSTEEKKRAILQCSVNCGNLHPFMDGNGRVFAELLPMRLYHDLDGSLPLLDYPWKNGHSSDEIFNLFEKAAEESKKMMRD